MWPFKKDESEIAFKEQLAEQQMCLEYNEECQGEVK